jgi:hypothetical protein
LLLPHFAGRLIAKSESCQRHRTENAANAAFVGGATPKIRAAAACNAESFSVEKLCKLAMVK